MTDIAERLAAREARDDDMQRRMERIERQQEECTASLHRIETQLAAQAATRRVGGWLAEGARTLVTAIAAAVATTHWLAR